MSRGFLLDTNVPSELTRPQPDPRVAQWREYLKHGIREIAQDLCTRCTRQIGYRTSHDAAEAERREIGEKRFTSLDRAILRDAHLGTQVQDSGHFTVTNNAAEMGLADPSRRHFKHIVSRLAFKTCLQFRRGRRHRPR